MLGPVEAHAGRHRLDLGGPKQRSLMALLLIEQGRPVASDRLADQLWNGNPPDGAATTLRSYVSRLRTTLGSETVIGAKAGYALAAAVDSVDAHRFEELTKQGESALRRGAPGTAAERLHAALALLAGPGLRRHLRSRALTLEARRLEELRFVCLEQRIEADLDLGRHGEVVAELQRLLEEEPYANGSGDTSCSRSTAAIARPTLSTPTGGRGSGCGRTRAGAKRGHRARARDPAPRPAPCPRPSPSTTCRPR